MLESAPSLPPRRSNQLNSNPIHPLSRFGLSASQRMEGSFYHCYNVRYLLSQSMSWFWSALWEIKPSHLRSELSRRAYARPVLSWPLGTCRSRQGEAPWTDFHELGIS